MVDLEFMPPLRQKSWGKPAVLNLTLSGAGAGLYLLGVLFLLLGYDLPQRDQFVPFQMLAPLLVVCGFLAVFLEAGRPMRALYLFRNLPGSWMSIESLAGGIFIIATLVSRFLPHFILSTTAALAALIFMTSQGFMVYRAVAVKAWNVRLVPVLFVASGFMTASGLHLLNARISAGNAGLPVLIFLVLILLNLFVWLVYLYWNHDSDFLQAIKALRRPASLLVSVVFGHLMPFILILSIAVFGDFDDNSPLFAVIHTISGLALIVGGASQKTGIILKAGYFRGITSKMAQN